jgi:hypothetical protein
MLIILGNWNGGTRNFIDISTTNNLLIVHEIKIDTIAAKWCKINTTLKIYLQNQLLGYFFVPKEECNCFTCPYPYTFSASLQNFTKYHYGGINTLRIDSGSNMICIGKLKISLTFKSTNL